MNRTHNNGELRKNDINKMVELKGWVSKKRNLGGLIFIDLRDKYGITQIVVSPNNEIYDLSLQIKNEYVIYVSGKVVERENKNNDMITGDIEITADKIEILNIAKQPPIIVHDNTDALEDTRLKYRYLDLRRPVMQNYLIKRSQITTTIREFLVKNEFLELETPILAKSTPEGARDYLVPSRLYKNEFYALPQSPQIFKQLYMISGLERYYQIARCFRDEDLRSDRQPEFTQIDIETSFLSQDEIFLIVEDLFKNLFKKILKKELKPPFLRLTYDDAINYYGTDKPDLRFELKLTDVSSLFGKIEFMKKESVKAIIMNNASHYSRKKIDELTNIAKKYKASGLAFLKYKDNELSGSIAKNLSTEDKEKVIKDLSLKNDDLVLIIAGNKKIVNTSLGALRSHIGKVENYADKDEFLFAWIVDFPAFVYDDDEKRYYAAAHPFTMPKQDNIKLLTENPDECLAQAYDLVLNGYELGSGTMRIYNEKMQKDMFNTLGLSDDDINEKFGFFIEALKYGTPPHGGIGLGLDRIVMLMTKTDNIKNVIAFPKTQTARDLMCDSPSTVNNEQLKDIHIKCAK